MKVVNPLEIRLFLTALLVAVVALLAVPSVSYADNHGDAVAHDVSEAEAPTVVVENVRAFPARQGGNGAIYMNIKSFLPHPVKLIGVKSDVSRVVEIHTMSMDENGVMRMRPIEFLQIDSGASQRFEPGGYHIMIIGLKSSLEAGQTFPMSLLFDTHPPVETTVSVQSR